MSNAHNPGGFHRDDPRYGMTAEQVQAYYATRPAQWLIRSTYGPDALSKREAAMADHLAHLRRHREQLQFAGPLLSDDGAATGSYAIFEGPDRAAAETFINNEAFCRAGMFSDIDIKRFYSSLGTRQVELRSAPDMQLFVCECIDGPDAAALREQAGPAHQQFQSETSTRIIARGPILDDDAAQVIGSLLIIEVPHRAAAESFIESEPLTKAGVFAKVRIDRWRFGNAIGGA